MNNLLSVLLSCRRPRSVCCLFFFVFFLVYWSATARRPRNLLIRQNVTPTPTPESENPANADGMPGDISGALSTKSDKQGRSLKRLLFLIKTRDKLADLPYFLSVKRSKIAYFAPPAGAPPAPPPPGDFSPFFACCARLTLFR